MISFYFGLFFPFVFFSFLACFHFSSNSGNFVRHSCVFLSQLYPSGSRRCDKFMYCCSALFKSHFLHFVLHVGVLRQHYWNGSMFTIIERLAFTHVSSRNFCAYSNHTSGVPRCRYAIAFFAVRAINCKVTIKARASREYLGVCNNFLAIMTSYSSCCISSSSFFSVGHV